MSNPTTDRSLRPYVPARAAWTGNSNGNVTRGVSPPPNTVAIDPVELPVQSTPRAHNMSDPPLPKHQPTGHHRNQPSSDNYYEDVDPRFASEPTNTTHHNPSTHNPQPYNVPHTLMPGLASTDPNQHQSIQPTIENVDPSYRYDSYHEPQDGLISPAASDYSTMTSVSQRAINPNWRPQDGNLGVPSRRPVPPPQQQQRDMLLGSNPDLEVPGGARGAPMPIIHHGQAF